MLTGTRGRSGCDLDGSATRPTARDRLGIVGGDGRRSAFGRGPFAAFALKPRSNGTAIVDLASMLAGASLSFCLLGWLAATFASLWWVAVMVVIRSDLDDFIIPDGASAAVAALGLAFTLASSIDFGWTPRAVAEAVGTAALGGIAAWVVFWLIARLYRYRSGRDGLGFGDVKLAGASAIWLDARGQVTALEIAALAAIASVFLFRRGSDRRAAAVPFGAFMAPSAWLVFAAAPMLNPWLERLP